MSPAIPSSRDPLLEFLPESARPRWPSLPVRCATSTESGRASFLSFRSPFLSLPSDSSLSCSRQESNQGRPSMEMSRAALVTCDLGSPLRCPHRPLDPRPSPPQFVARLPSSPPSPFPASTSHLRRTCAAASLSLSRRHLVRQIRCLPAPSPTEASSPAPAPRSDHHRRQTRRPCSPAPPPLPVERAEDRVVPASPALGPPSSAACSIPCIIRSKSAAHSHQSTWADCSPAEHIHRPGLGPCSGYVASVRIRSTMLVRLLLGFGLLPSGISVAGADDASAGDATELKWEFDEDLGRYYVLFPDDQ